MVAPHNPGVQLPAQETELRRKDAGRMGGAPAGSGRGEICAHASEEGGKRGGRGGWGGAHTDDGGAIGVGSWGCREGEVDSGDRRREWRFWGGRLR